MTIAKLVSLNVKGLNATVKRHLLLTELRSLKANIVMLQETHFNKDGNFKFAQRLYPIAFQASQDRKKAGVVILVSRSWPLQVLKSISDPSGRFLILRALYQNTLFLLCNVYILNVSHISLLNHLLVKLSCFPPSAMLFRGDFNVAFSDLVDIHLLPGKLINPSSKRLSWLFCKTIRKFAWVNIFLFFASARFPRYPCWDT